MSQVERKWILDHAINNSKVDPTDTYTITGLRVDETNAVGRVGIGISNPLDALHIRRTDTSAGLMLDSVDGTNGERYQIYSGANGLLSFRDSTTGNLFTIGSTNEVGRVGINTATIEDHLHISSPSTDAALRLDLNDGTNGRAYRLVSDTDGAFRIIDVDATATRVQIANDGILTYNGDATFVGTVEMTGFVMPTGATDGLVLQCNGAGVGTWQSSSDGDWVIDGTDMYSGVSGNVGIGGSTADYKLDVEGTVNMSDFLMPTDATNGFVLTTDVNGNGTWQEGNSDDDWIVDGTDMYSGVSGNVGIGETAPSFPLDVRHSSFPFIANFARRDSGEAIIQISDSDSTTYVGNNNTKTFIGGTNTLHENNLVILDSGEVGLGTTNPTYKFDASHATDDIIGNFVSGDSIAFIKVSDSVGDTYLGTVSSTTTIGENNALHVNNLNIDNLGKVGIGTTDPRYKLDLETTDATMASFYSSHADRGLIRLEHSAQVSNIVAELNRISIGGNPSLHANNLNIFNTNGYVGIGTITPGNPLEIVGTAEMTGFLMPTSASNGYVLTSDGAGVGTWQVAAGADSDWDIVGSDICSAVSGFVGIGTATPTRPLSVYHPTEDIIANFESGTDVAMIRIVDDSAQAIVGVEGENAFFGGTGGLSGNNIVVKPTGEVGIGTTDPTIKLDVVGNARISAIGSSASSPTALYFDSTGELTSNTSDLRLKYDIKTLENVLEKVVKLRGVNFKWKQNDEQMVGMIAQELEQEYPELVFTNRTTGYMGIRYSEFTAVLLESVKGLNLKSSKMVSKIESLESKISEMMDM